MKKILSITLLSVFILSNANAFFWSKKEVDPSKLKTDQERMDWLRKHKPEAFKDVDAKGSWGKDEEKLYKQYLEDTKEPLTPEILEQRRLDKLKKEKEAQDKANKELEELIKKGYKFVDGQLISKDEQEKLKQQEAQKEIETLRVIEFYEEMEIPLPAEGDKIEMKED